MKTSDKKSFILYTNYEDFLSELTDEQMGKLFRQVFAYVKDETEMEINDGMVRMAWKQIKGNLDRDLRKWQDIRQKRVEAGIKSAEARQKQKADN